MSVGGIGRPLLYKERLVPVNIMVDAEVYQKYRHIQEAKLSSASAGIREFIRRTVMQSEEEPQKQEQQQLTIPNF